MLLNTNALYKKKIHAQDGDIGHLDDLLFDDTIWGARYLVVDTGRWLPGRQVLISPQAFIRVNWTDEAVKVDMTREQIGQSPSIEKDKPVTRQHEIELAGYYGWGAYWANPAFAAVENESLARRPKGDPHLRSTREVEGYRIEATDGEIGHLESCIVDSESWLIRYLVVDTRNWLPGRTVLLAPSWAREVDWGTRKLVIDHAREEVRQSPEWDARHPVKREYETELHHHFARPGYWDIDPEEVPKTLVIPHAQEARFP